MGVKVRTRVSVPVGQDFSSALFHSFEGLPPGEEHFLVAFGPYDDQEVPLVRIHSECITGDLFGSQRCDCGPQLEEAIQTLQQEGGYLVYLRQEGRGIGLYNKLDAYVLQDRGLDTYEANRSLRFPDDLRAFRPAAEMLRALGLGRIRLLTNNPQKVEELEKHGVEVVEVVPTGVYINKVNSRYLHSKALHARHTLALSDPKHHTRGTEAAS
jgi:GTP cyclohydrolase II